MEYGNDPDEARDWWPYSPVEVLPVWALLWSAEDALTDGLQDREIMPRVVVRLRQLRNRLYWAGCRECGKRIELPTTAELDEAFEGLHDAIKREAWRADQSPAAVERLAKSAKVLRAARKRWDAEGLSDED